jgi:hypothetical protein
MALRLAVAAVLATAALASSPALACMGPTVLLAENFQTNDPAWVVPIDPGLPTNPPLNPGSNVTISAGYAALTPPVAVLGVAEYGGDIFPSADVCVDILSPAVADPSQAAGGIMFGFKLPYTQISGYAFYVFAIEEDGQAAVMQYQYLVHGAHSWTALVPWQAAPTLKPGGNATNTLRVTYKGTSGTAYINNEQFASFTLPAFTNTTIGFFCEGVAGVNPTTGATWQFTNLKVTNVP